MQSDYVLSGAAFGSSAPASQTTTDEFLMRGIARGDKRAMQVLFARHNVRVYRFIVRLVGDAATAEDLVSEVFLDVWRKASQFEGRSQVSTWLLAIARFKALSQLRSRSVDHLDDEAAHAIEDPSDSPEAVLEKKDRGSLLRKCLMQLSQAHREVVDLVYYHEKSMEEAAVVLQIPEATVRTRMFYARKRLAELLKGEGIEHAPDASTELWRCCPRSCRSIRRRGVHVSHHRRMRLDGSGPSTRCRGMGSEHRHCGLWMRKHRATVDVATLLRDASPRRESRGSGCSSGRGHIIN